MINLLICSILLAITITPQNIFWEKYKIIPPLGHVKAFSASSQHIYAISDQYLLALDKLSLDIEKTIYFDEDIYLLAYDQFYNDLWVIAPSAVIRLRIASYMATEYQFNGTAERIAVDQDYLYIDGERNMRLDKRTGAIEIISFFPGNLDWHTRFSEMMVKQYPFLTPYHYVDEPGFSNTPLRQFAITALYDNGMDLYVGTNGYGILKYDKVSWQKQKVVYGPLDLSLHKVRKFDDTIYFLSSQGISFYPGEDKEWKYHRFNNEPVDIFFANKELYVAFGTKIAQPDEGMTMTISTMPHDILCMHSEGSNIYIGTSSGLYRMSIVTTDAIPFGPEKFNVYSVLTTDDRIYAGGENGLYSYDRKQAKWHKEIGFGIKDIVEISDNLFLLGVNNQIIKYPKQTQENREHEEWTLLPYFNIYDIDTDGKVLYCASFAGIYYYEPATDLYKIIYNLPRDKYDHVFVTDTNIIAVAYNNILSLPIAYRD